MPELPEVETIRRMLEPKLAGRKIISCKIFLPRLLKNIGTEELSAAVTGRTIISLDRRGKFLLLKFDYGILVIHLRMTGRLKIRNADESADKYCRVEFLLDNGQTLQYADTRTLGTMHWFADEAKVDIRCILKMGPEPFPEKLGKKYFVGVLKQSSRNVKALLLDQSFIAGLGNIYVDEALHAAGILPQRTADTLSKAEQDKLFYAIQAVIAKAIANCGTSFRDYVDGEGNKGRNQDELQVYGRRGCRCLRCGATIMYGRIAGRGTHWCSACQK